MTMRIRLILTLAFLICCAAPVPQAAPTAGLPPVPRVSIPLLNETVLKDSTAARKAWKALWGTAPASATEVAGTKVLHLPCNFKGTSFERATWDRKLDLDLTMARGLQFHIYVPNPTPIASYTIYFHSGNGWYATSFGQKKLAGWSTVEIEKTQTQIEGKPAGWGKIDTIRISAFRGQDVDTDLYLANMGVLGADAPIVIVRGESAAKKAAGEAESISQYAQAVAQALDELDLPYAAVSDLDLTPARLRGKRIVILPHNPQMPEAVVQTLNRFVQNGGKIVSFYVLPAALGQAVGIRTGRFISGKADGLFASIRATEPRMTGLPAEVKQSSWAITHAEPAGPQSRVAALWFNEKGESTGEPAIVASDRGVHMTHVLLAEDPTQRQMLVLAMLGHLAPELWKQAAEQRIQLVGQFGEFASFDEMEKSLKTVAAGKPAAQSGLEKANQLRGEAQRLFGAKQYPEALAKAGEAGAEALRTYCLLQEPQAGEHRAWWCHSAFGVTGMDWDKAIKTLADNGFNVIHPNMLWGGVAYYESSVLPVAPEIKQRGDQIAQCLAACKKYGVECHVWKVNWNMGNHAPQDFVARMQREGRTQVGYDGKPTPQWLCPSHPANQQLEIDAMTEVATKYDVDGIHFDYIRYPGPEGCFCAGCRERFEKVLGRKVAHWPADTRYVPATKQAWLDFRRANITNVVAGVSERVRKARPKVKISAAVFRNWPVDRDGVGQDWKLWCEKGYLDFVCPMDYTPHAAQFENIIKLQRGWAGKAPVYPGIGVSVWQPKGDIVKLMEFIKITRRLGTGGFTVFNYAGTEANELVPRCGLGLTRRP